MNPFDLTGRTAIITGSGGGVGRGIAIAMGAAGANVVIAARRAETGDLVAKEITEAGGKVLSFEVDIGKPEAVKKLVAQTLDTFGGIDVLVNNAISNLASKGVRLEDLDLELLEGNMRVAPRGSFFCLREVLPHLQRERGRIINILAHGAFRGHGFLSTYSITKSMQRGFTKAIAAELGPRGITVNAITPVAMTEGMERYYKQRPEELEKQASRSALRFIGTPARDIGGTAVFFASDAARYVTGQNMFVDGGAYFQ